MEIDFNTFDRILFGDLRPWLSHNLDESKFESILYPPLKTNFSSPQKLLSFLQDSLKEHPKTLFGYRVMISIADDSPTDLSYFFESDEDNDFIVPLTNIDIEPYFDNKTEYYFLLITLEENRILKEVRKLLYQNSVLSKSKEFIEHTLKKLQYLLIENHNLLKKSDYQSSIAEMLFRQPLEEEAIYQKKVNHSIFANLETILINLYLEIHNKNTSILATNQLSESEILNDILDEPSKSSRLKAELSIFFEKWIDNILNNQLVTDKLIISLIDELTRQIRYDKKYNTPEFEVMASEVLYALENLHFMHSNNLLESHNDFKFLKDQKQMIILFEDQKGAISDSIDSIPLPNKKLAFISLTKNEYSWLRENIKLSETSIKKSIPRLIIDWLDIEQKFYESNLSITSEISFQENDKVYSLELNESPKLPALPKKELKRLNRSETAILYFLLRKKDATLGLSNNALSILINHLTGYSNQNIRESLSQQNIEELMSRSNFSNLQAVEDFLQEVLMEIDHLKSKLK